MVKLWGKKKKNKDVTDEDDVGSGSDAEDMPLTERQEWQLILGEPDEILHTTSTSVNHRKKSIHMSHVVTPGSAVLHVDTSLKKTSSPVYTIPKIVRADLDEDRTFMSLFDKIELASGALLLPPTAYLLQYQLAESPLCINVDFKVHTQVMSAFDKFAALGVKKFSKLNFRLMPRVRGGEMYRIEKPKTVKVRLDNRNAINRYLSEDFVRGNIGLAQYSKIMAAKMADAKGLLALHLSNTVPHEFKDHQYLTKQREKSKNHLSPEERYDKGQITVEEFEDLKYPELKAKRERQQATYPLSEALEKCVICDREDTASIKCLECDHKACCDCIYREFTKHVSCRPFLLMHSIFCCKRGIPVRGWLPPVKKYHAEQYARHPDIEHHGEPAAVVM